MMLAKFMYSDCAFSLSFSAKSPDSDVAVGFILFNSHMEVLFVFLKDVNFKSAEDVTAK